MTNDEQLSVLLPAELRVFVQRVAEAEDRSALKHPHLPRSFGTTITVHAQ